MTLVVMECYEDMFKEITRKLYGEEEVTSVMVEYDSLATLVSNTIGDEALTADDDTWIASDENLSWTESKIASYNTAQKLFRCSECESVGVLSRVAEHWLGTHANLRVFQCPQCPYTSAWSRCVRMHLSQQHNVTTDQSVDTMTQSFWKESPVLDEVTKYLQRLKSKLEGEEIPATEICEEPIKEEAVEFVQEEQNLPESPLQNASVGTSPTNGKRYNCNYCPYATDRRDLYTRHENIHREEKLFHCYICLKQFNRADHVKKHFVRMHRDVCYDINRIRREIGKTPSQPYFPASSTKVVQTGTIKADTNNAPAVKPAKTRIKIEKAAKRIKPGDKRYSCPYCAWSGVDNWCLKRHLNTHLKPFVCSLCEYKAARSERLTIHMYKVHNKRACSKCSFLADELALLTAHQQQQHP